MMLTTTMVSVIRDAIRNRLQLTFWCNGHYRQVSPHMLGRKNGEWHMLGWQINDDSEKGFAPEGSRWRCFELEDMSQLESQEGEWHRGWTSGRGRQYCIDEDDMDTVVDAMYGAEIRSTSR